MNNPYRVYSTLCFGFIHLLMMSTLAYPAPIPPVYHNMAIIRIISTAGLGIFPTSRAALFIDCGTIAAKVITDGLYIRYIVSNFTYIMGILDIVSDTLFVGLILYSTIYSDDEQEYDVNSNDNNALIDKIRRTLKKIRGKLQYCLFTCCGRLEENEYMKNSLRRRFNGDDNETTNTAHEPIHRFTKEYDPARGHYAYTSVETNNNTLAQTPNQAPNPAPVLNHMNGHMKRPLRPFKKTFYMSYPQNTPNPNNQGYETEYENIETLPTTTTTTRQSPYMMPPTPMINQTNMMYMNFDSHTQIQVNAPDTDYSGAFHYSNSLVSSFYDSSGSPITFFSSYCSTTQTLFVLCSLFHFIYQIMMNINIIKTCDGIYFNTTSQDMGGNNAIMRFLC